jgi:hypothetical protein
VLFEAWLTPFLTEKYRTRGMTRKAIEKKFKTGYREVPEGISDVCSRLVLDLCKGHVEQDEVLAARIQQATAEIEAIFKTGETHFPMGISEICEKLLPEIIGREFVGTDVQVELAKKAIALRNKLVHGGRMEVSEEEARACAWSVIDAVGVINSLAFIHEANALFPQGKLIVEAPPHPFPDITSTEEKGILSPPGFMVTRQDPGISTE